MSEAVRGSRGSSPLRDRIRLDLDFDLERMQQEVLELPRHPFLEYSVLPLTEPVPVDLDHEGPIDYADGSWAIWRDTSNLEDCPYLTTIVGFFREHTTVTCVRLLRLAPGALVNEHTDPTLGLHVENSVVRLTIPILSNDRVPFLLDGRRVEWEPGECWYLDFTRPHTTENRGSEERIHLSIDMLPNAWVRHLIEGRGETDAVSGP